MTLVITATYQPSMITTLRRAVMMKAKGIDKKKSNDRGGRGRCKNKFNLNIPHTLPEVTLTAADFDPAVQAAEWKALNASLNKALNSCVDRFFKNIARIVYGAKDSSK